MIDYGDDHRSHVPSRSDGSRLTRNAVRSESNGVQTERLSADSARRPVVSMETRRTYLTDRISPRDPGTDGFPRLETTGVTTSDVVSEFGISGRGREDRRGEKCEYRVPTVSRAPLSLPANSSQRSGRWTDLWPRRRLRLRARDPERRRSATSRPTAFAIFTRPPLIRVAMTVSEAITPTSRRRVKP